MTARRRWRHAVVALLSGLATLFAIEVAFRIHAAMARAPTFVDYEVYADNPRGYFKPCENGAFCPDRDRSLHACAAPITTGMPQVLFVGDSFTLGQGVDAKDTFSSLLSFPGYQRRNCAVSGNSIDAVHRDFMRERARYRPALTVYGMVLNDFGIDAVGGDEFAAVGGPPDINDYIMLRLHGLDALLARRQASPLLRLALRSRAVSFFYRRALLQRVGRLTAEGYRKTFGPGPARDHGFAQIRAMAAESERFLVVLWPLLQDLRHYPFEDIHRTIRDELARANIEVLDLLDVLRGRDERALWVYDYDQHPNEVAHQLAADAIRQRLRTLAWPPFVSGAPQRSSTPTDQTMTPSSRVSAPPGAKGGSTAN